MKCHPKRREILRKHEPVEKRVINSPIEDNMECLNWHQSSVIFEKLGILSKNLKTSTSSNYPRVQYFLLTLRTLFLLINLYENVCGIYFILFLSWVMCKKIKRPGFYTLVIYIFINNSRSKQSKKNLDYSFLDIVK